MKSLKVLLVAGARSNFMKIAPLISAINKFNYSVNSSDRKSQVARTQGVNETDPINTSNAIDSSNPINSTRTRDSYSPLTSSEVLLKPPTVSVPIDYLLVHTGQHYDLAMSGTFFMNWKFQSPT